MGRAGALRVRVLAALVLLVATSPFSYAIAVQGGRPAFTLDICHPPQLASQAGGRILVPGLPGPMARPLLYLCGVVQRLKCGVPTREAFAPDPPPPKASV